MMENALAYARAGLSVIPVQPQGKEPLVPWVKYQAAVPEPEEIASWFAKTPMANIGIVTGSVSGLVVVDLDGAEGLESGQRLNLRSPVTVLTGRGKQLYYRHPGQRITNSVKKVAPGVDIRGDGGFVVAPPSLHPNGKRYCWAGSPMSRNLLPPLPTMFLEQERRLPGLAKRNEAGWVADAIKEMRNGHIHNTLIRVLGKFRQHNFTEEETYVLLHPHALQSGEPYADLREKIAEFWARYAAPAAASGGSKSETIEDFLQDIQKPEWICEPFIARKSIGFIVGLPETLKTWLCVDLAVECAVGNGQWLGLFPTTNCKVLFVDQERWKGETQRRFNSVIAGKGMSPNTLKNGLFLKSGTTIRLNLDASYQAFRTELLEMRPDLVIVDSFATFHTLPENDRTEIQKVLERVKDLRNDIGCTFLFINHESKMAYPNGEPQGEPNMGTMVGSIGIGAAAEFCLTVRKVENNTSLVWHTKSTLAQKAKAFYASVQDVDGGIIVRGLSD